MTYTLKIREVDINEKKEEISKIGLHHPGISVRSDNKKGRRSRERKAKVLRDGSYRYIFLGGVTLSEKTWRSLWGGIEHRTLT